MQEVDLDGSDLGDAPAGRGSRGELESNHRLRDGRRVELRTRGLLLFGTR